MRNYIKNNLAPMLIGAIIGLLVTETIRTIDDIVVKIYILKQSKTETK